MTDIRKELEQWRDEMVAEILKSESLCAQVEAYAFRDGFNALVEPMLNLVEALKLSHLSEESQMRMDRLSKEQLISILIHLHVAADQALADFKETIKKGRMG